jgi:hypothetical protein
MYMLYLYIYVSRQLVAQLPVFSIDIEHYIHIVKSKTEESYVIIIVDLAGSLSHYGLRLVVGSDTHAQK